MGARTSAGQRRAAKVRARRRRTRVPERARGPRERGGPHGHRPPPQLHPLAVLDGVDPLAPDEDLLLTALELAVLRTIDTGSPEVGDEVALRISELDAEYRDAVEAEELDDPDGPMPADPMFDGWEPIAWDVLAEWLETAQARPDTATVVERVLRWVEERLGRSGPGPEGETFHLGGPVVPHPLDLAECLRDDILAIRVWLVAGLVAVTGSGGPAALLDPPAPDTRPFRRRHAAAAR